jgi:hypothetical protein
MSTRDVERASRFSAGRCRARYPRKAGRFGPAPAEALVLYWVAHSYAEFAGHRLTSAGRLTLAGIARAMLHEVSLLAGASVPLIPLLVWWVAGGQLANAVTAAVWTSALTIAMIELIAGLRARLSGRDLLGQVALGALLGLLVIALKIVLH